MNFIAESNPQIRALARETSQKIKTLTNAHEAELKAIYREFRAQADAIKAEASTKSLTRSGADSFSQTTEQTNRKD
jgi:predicted GIY-YIG superfamily endonuclease